MKFSTSKKKFLINHTKVKDFVNLRRIYIQNIYDGKWKFSALQGDPIKIVPFLH